MARNNKQAAKRKKVKVKVTKGKGLDEPARQYAALLVDPCNQPLARPLYAGTGTGYLIRLQSSLVLTFDATNTCARYVLAPGAFDGEPAGTSCHSMVQYGLGGNTIPVATYDKSYVPGNTFLGSMVSSFRPVAACVEMSYLGKEQDKGGCFTASSQDYQTITSVANMVDVINGAADVMRTPDAFSLKWCPTEEDAEWVDQTGATADTAGDYVRNRGRSALQLSLSAMTAGTSVRFKSTVVLEWRPSGFNQMVSADVETPHRSRHTLTDVLQYLQGMGDWLHTNTRQAAQAASAVYGGVQGARSLARGVQLMIAST